MGTLTLKPDFMELINCNIFSTFNISAHWIFPIFVLFLWMKSNVLHLVGQLKGWTMNLTFICQLSEIFFLFIYFFLPCINWHKNMNLKKYPNSIPTWYPQRTEKPSIPRFCRERKTWPDLLPRLLLVSQDGARASTMCPPHPNPPASLPLLGSVSATASAQQLSLLACEPNGKFQVT